MTDQTAFQADAFQVDAFQIVETPPVPPPPPPAKPVTLPLPSFPDFGPNPAGGVTEPPPRTKRAALPKKATADSDYPTYTGFETYGRHGAKRSGYKPFKKPTKH